MICDANAQRAAGSSLADDGSDDWGAQAQSGWQQLYVPRAAYGVVPGPS